MSPATTLRHAVRRLRRAPGFSLAATITLALGIGGTVAVFTVVNGVLIRPLPYPRSAQLVDLSHTLSVNGTLNVDQSDATYLVYHDLNQVFSSVAAYRATSVNLAATNDAAATPERVSAAIATPTLFEVLETGVMRGRPLTASDGEPGAPPVVVIGAGLWQRAFGGDPAIIGRTLLVDGVERTVVGIARGDFRFPDGVTSLWLPLQLDPAHTNSAAFDYRGIARLKPGVTVAAATADLSRLLPQVPVIHPGRLTAGAITATKMVPVVQPLRQVVVGNVGRILWIVLGAVGLLLLVACANVAGLFVARAEGRQRELAVRRALGAGRAGLLGEYLGEAVLLSAAGAVVGLVAAAEAVHVLVVSPAAASIPRLGDVRIDGVVVAFTFAVTLVAALVMSVVPAWRSMGSSVAALLTSESTNTTGSASRQRMRRALVMAQVALALVLLAGAGLFVRSFEKLERVDPGFTPANALAFRVELPAATYPGGGVAARTLVDMAAAIHAVPGVHAVGIGSALPLGVVAPQDSAVLVEDHPRLAGQLPDIRPIVFADSGYFGAMGIPLLAGRTFAPVDPMRDPATAPREVIVSAAFATRYWSVRDAIGKRIRMNPIDGWSTIVGVVGSVHQASLEVPAEATVYLPLLTASVMGTPYTPHDVAFVVRGGAGLERQLPAIRDALGRVAPALPMYRLVSLSAMLAASTARVTFIMLLLAIAAVVATAIGATGIYGVVSYLVSLRTREIGVRLALGARPEDVERIVLRRAVVDALLGVGIGLIGAVGATRVLARVLFGVAPTDPVVLSIAALVLLVTATAAGWVPARRAARLDPVVALRG